MSALSGENKSAILDIILKKLNKETTAVFLFGSFANEEIYPSSDIDIGVIADNPIPRALISTIKDELETVKTLRDIDVIDFGAITDKVFLKEALQEIVIWHQTKQSKTYLDNLRKRIKG